MLRLPVAEGVSRRAGPRSKYRAMPSWFLGRRFASKAEMRRYQELLLIGYAGEIRNLELQPRFPLLSGGKKMADYVADFRYEERSWGKHTIWSSLPEWRDVVEDVKGMKTPMYRLKRKLFQAQYPTIDFREVR